MNMTVPSTTDHCTRRRALSTFVDATSQVLHGKSYQDIVNKWNIFTQAGTAAGARRTARIGQALIG